MVKVSILLWGELLNAELRATASGGRKAHVRGLRYEKKLTPVMVKVSNIN